MMSHYERCAAYCGICPQFKDDFSISISMAFVLDKYIVQFCEKVRENVPDFRRIPMMQWAERLPLNKLVFHHWRHTSDEVTKEKRILDQLIKDDAIDGDIFKILLLKKLYLDKRNRK